jgi:hypothetical protein
MDTISKKLSLIKWLTELNDSVIINKIEKLKELHDRQKNYSTFSIDDLVARHKRSEDDIANNRTIDQKELIAYFSSKING